MKKSPITPELLGTIALFSVYILWGTTFLGIRLAVETVPPLIVGMSRHTFGGALLLVGLFLFKKFEKPTLREARNALFIGGITAGISNGALTWSEVNVPSSYASIAFTTMPL